MAELTQIVRLDGAPGEMGLICRVFHASIPHVTVFFIRMYPAKHYLPFPFSRTYHPG